MKKKNNQHKKYLRALFILGVLFFFIYSFLPFIAGEIFNSPDANANFVFTKNLVERGDLKIFEPLNRIAGNIVHPRSANVSGAFIVPGSFLGLILIYGFLAKLAGIIIAPYLTPLFSVFGALFFYGIVRRVFNSQIAFISSLLMLIHPSFWYYASRTMIPNVLFISLLLGGFYFVLKIKGKNKWYNYFLGGVLFGLALSVRMSEIVWLGLTLLILIIAYHKNIHWKYFILGCLVLIIALTPVFYFQYTTYGNPFLTGYSNLDSELAGETVNQAGILNIIFPFGVEIKPILKNSFNYLVNIFWWFALAAVLGLGFFIYYYRDWAKRQKLFFWLSLFISVWLLIYYGSWIFHDNPDPNKITIGTSYVRYWLPIYILSLPFVSFFIVKGSKLLRYKKTQILAMVILILFLIYPSAQLVLWQTEESLVNVGQNLLEYREIKEQILEYTEDDSIIIASYMDKVLFPERRVIHNIVDKHIQENLPAVLEKSPVYVYSLFPPRDIEFLNNKRLNQYNLKLIDYKGLSNEAKLMKLEFINEKNKN